VLLLAVAVVLALTIYVAVRPPGESSRAPVGRPGPSAAERTRRVIEELLAKADALNVKSGPVGAVARREAYETACRLAASFIQREDRNDIVVRPMLARAQLRLGRLKDAERTIDELLRLSPESAQGLWMKGELVRARGGKDAVEYLRRAAESEEATAEIWARYGAALLSQGQVAAGEGYFQRAYDAGQRDRPTLLALAERAMREHEFARAEERFAEAVRIGPPSALVLSRLAEAQKDGGRLEAAEKTLREAMALQDAPELWLRLGDVLLLQRRRAEAAELYAKAAEHPLSEAAGAFKAARVYYFLEKYALAMKYIDRVAEHAETPQVRQWRKMIEDARFGEPVSSGAPALRLPPAASLLEQPAGSEGDEQTGREAAEPATQPLRLLR
jgi:tetratricopeptide (TPR) repeat protein